MAEIDDADFRNQEKPDRLDEKIDSELSSALNKTPSPDRAAGRRPRRRTAMSWSSARGRMRPPRVRGRIHTLDSFRHRDFRFLWLSTLSVSGGFWTQMVVVGWLTYERTRSPLLTSLVLGLDSLPFLIAGPIGGVLADTWDRRRLLMAATVYQALVTTGFATVLILGRGETWHIFVFAFAMGLSWALSEPSKSALIPNVVPASSLVNAFALHTLAFGASRLVMPLVGGVLVVAAGPGPTLLMSSALYAATFISTRAIGPPAPLERVDGGARPLRRFLQGANYVRDNRVILGLMMLLGATALVFFPFVHGLLPVYASDVYGVDAAGLGLLMSLIGAGNIIGTVIAASVGNVRRKGVFIVVSLAVMAAAMAVFSRASGMASAVPLLMLVNGAMMAFLSMLSASVNSIVPDVLRGRVASISTMTFGIFPAGSLIAGALAQLLGVQDATLVAGAALVALSAAILLKFPQILAMGKSEEQAL
jgi:predicted MFS family arabinose efflux permease